jgi:hypothetical protein
MLAAQESGKQFQAGEFDLYSYLMKALNSNQFPDAQKTLEQWRQKYPESQYKDERQAFLVQTYAGLNQPAKALDAAMPLLARDPKSVFAGAAGQPLALRLLYSAAWAVSHTPNPTPQQLASGEKAARDLLAWEQPLEGVPAAKWEEARADMKEKANAALLYIAMQPGVQAMAKQPPDCTGAEAVYRKALGEYPEKSILSWELGRALSCITKDVPAKAPEAIYEFERAAVVDPTLGGARNDPKQVQSYADNAYTRFHGGDEGLAQLKDLVKRAPLPPAEFTIKSGAQIVDETQRDFDAAHPELALWNKIKAALTAADGNEYFETGMKGAAVPELSGKLVEAKPACRPRELTIAISSADAKAEVDLKLDKPLTGKPDVGQEIRWQGVASAFSKEPFLLTMDVEAGSLAGVKQTVCARPVNTKK